MSFLVADGHVEVTAKTGDAERDIRSLITTLSGLGPAAQTASNGLKDLRTRATASGAALGTMAGQARDAERTLLQLKAAAGDIRVSAQIADETRSGVTAVKAAIRDLKAESPVRLAARLEAEGTASVATMRAAIRDLKAESPVRLTARMDDQTSSTLATIRDSVRALKAETPIRLAVQLDSDTTAGVARTRQALRDLKAESPVRLTATFDGDGSQISAAARSMRDLRGDARDTATALTSVAARADTTAGALDNLSDQARQAGRNLAHLRAEAGATATVLATLRTASSSTNSSLRTLATRAATAGGRMGDLSDRSRTLRDDLTTLNTITATLTGRLNGLRGGLRTVGPDATNASDGVGSLLDGVLLLAPALIPIAAAGAPIAASMSAAAAGTVAFGAAIVPQISLLADASEAETKYQDAVEEHGRTSKQAVEAQADYARTMAQMPRPVREAAAAFSVLKDEYKDWSKSLAGDTMQPFTRGMAVLGALLPKLTPLVRSSSRELSGLMAVLGGAVQTPGIDRAIGKITDLSSRALRRARQELAGFIGALETGQVGGGLRQFLDYARANGPLVAATLGNIAQAGAHLLLAFSDVGVSVLGVANALAKLVNAVPSDVLSTLVQLYATFKLITLAGSAFGSASGFITGHLGRMRTAAAGTTGAMARLRAALGSLSGGARFGLVAAGIALVAVGAKKLADAFRQAPPNVERLSRSLVRLARDGKSTGEAARLFGKDLGGFSESVARIAHPSVLERVKDVGHTLVTLGLDTEAGLKEAREELQGTDKALAELVRAGNADVAAAAFAHLAKAGEKGHTSTAKLRGMLPKYKDALADARMEQQLIAQSMGLFGNQAMKTKSTLDAQKKSADGLRQAIQELNDVNRAGLGGMIAFEQAIDDATKAAKKNAGALSMTHGRLDLNSQKSRDAAQALQDLAQRTDEAAASARESGASWQRVSGIYQRGRSAFVQSAQAMGLTRREANQLADQLLKIPDSKKTRVRMETEDALKSLSAVISAIKKTPDKKSVTVKALSAGAVTALQDLGLKVKRLPDGSFKITAKTGDVGNKLSAVKKLRDGLKDKTITLSAKAVSALKGLDSVIVKIRKTPGSKTITVKSLTGSAINALEDIGFKVKKLPDGRISVTARTSSATANIAAVQRARDRLSSKSITITTNRVTNIMTNYVVKRSKGATFAQNGSYWRAGGGLAPGFADGGSTRTLDLAMFPEGGVVTGPGTGTSDSIMAISMAGMPYRISNSEYVIRADSVAKYGVPLLDAINEGRFELPRFASGGKLSQSAKDARRQLTSDTTFTAAGTMARYKYVEVVHDLGMPESVGSLVTSINTYLRNIKAAFSGSTESSLVRQLNSAGPTLFAYQRQIEETDKKLESAKNSLADLKGEFDSLRSSVKGSLVAFGNITKVGKWGTSPQTLINQLQQDATRTTQFAGQLDKLKAMGLDPAIIKDIAEAGITGGGMATATSLLGATPQQIAEINRLQKQLTDSADRAGKTTADAMYGAGIRAGEGLVAGLEAQHDRIRKAMMDIAKSMEKAIKRALGIASPAKRMEPIGDYAAQGVEVGWARRMARGRTLISGAEPARITSPTSSAVTAPLPPAAATAGPMPAPAGLTVQTLNVNVGGTFDFASPAERRAVARALVKDMNAELRAYQRQRAGGR